MPCLLVCFSLCSISSKDLAGVGVRSRSDGWEGLQAVKRKHLMVSHLHALPSGGPWSGLALGPCPLCLASHQKALCSFLNIQCYRLLHCDKLVELLWPLGSQDLTRESTDIVASD